MSGGLKEHIHRYQSTIFRIRFTSHYPEFNLFVMEKRNPGGQAGYFISNRV
jgi:hypothetical protein